MREPSATHLWFYVLIPVLGLYALNTLLATWISVVRNLRGGVRSLRAYAPAVIHLAFLSALLAHLVGGFGGAERGSITLGPSWRGLDREHQARVTALDVEQLPNGGIKQVRATVEIRTEGGPISSQIVSYNGPVSSGLGSNLALLQRPTTVGTARLERAGERCEVESGEVCRLGEAQAGLLFLHPPRSGSSPALSHARVQVEAEAPAEEAWLVKGKPMRLADGTALSLEGVGTRPAILLRLRHAPGNPWALLSAVMLTLGLLMMWRRFL